MSALVEELKQEHASLIKSLDDVKARGFASEAGKKELFAVKALLLAHLEKEDARLYPALHKAAASDASLKATLATLAKDMDEISKLALQFFGTYSQHSEGVDFARDYGRLHATLGVRIRKEEQTIYAKFDELANEAPPRTSARPPHAPFAQRNPPPANR